MSAKAHVIHVWGHLSPQILYPAGLYLTPETNSRHQALAPLHGAEDDS